MSWDRVPEMLAEIEGDDPDDFTEASWGGMGNGQAFDGPGRATWLVFEDSDDAESAAVDHVRDMLEEDASMFTQSWLSNFVTISPTTARVIAIENADSYWNDISGGRAIEEAGLEDELEELEEARDTATEKLEEAIEDLEVSDDYTDEEWDELEAARDAAEEAAYATYETKAAGLVEQAREQGAEAMAEDEAEYIQRDPMGWMSDFGYDMGSLPDFASIDYDAAAQDAVDTDGVGHFLAGYDGNEYDLDDGFVAYRQD